MPPHAETLLASLVTAGFPALSPDGSAVVFVVRRADILTNAYRNQLWIAWSDRPDRARPLATEALNGRAAISPDGEQLAFATRRGADPRPYTLHVLPLTGPGETITVATAAEEIRNLSWSPDGRWLAYDSRCRSARYEETDPAKLPPRRIERFFHRLNGEGWTYDRPRHVYVVPADGTDVPLDLTPGEFEFGEPSWLADSSGVVASGRGHDTWDTDLAVDLYVVGLDGQRRALTERTGNYSHPAVSPDGTTVAFLGYDDPSLEPQNTRVGVIDLASRERRWISLALDRTFAPTAGVSAPVWDSGALFAAAEDRGDTLVFRLDPQGSRAPVAVTPGDRVVTGFAVAGGLVAYSAAQVDRPAELAAVPAGGGAPVQLSALSERLVARTAPRPADRFTSPSSDGVEVDTWVLTPPGFDPAGSYPVLLNVHGGPFTQYGNTYFDEAQVQAAAGYVVVLCNPRGSSGRDDAWGQAIAGPGHPRRPGGGWGSVDVVDVLAALDETLRRYPAADRERVGMLGGSYGGYMATWLAAHHGERFRAICSERAVNNLVSEEWNSDIATAFRTEFGVTHLEDPATLARMSPISAVQQIRTPMLIIHSEDDLRCPVTQAEELWVALRLLGRDVRFYRFPAESHELSRSGSPRHRLQRFEIILDFFAEHLTPDGGR